MGCGSFSEQVMILFLTYLLNAAWDRRTKPLSYKVKYISMKALFEEQFSRN